MTLVNTPASLTSKDDRGRTPLDVMLAADCRKYIIEKLQEQGIASKPHQLFKSPCTHYSEEGEYCDRCGKIICPSTTVCLIDLDFEI